MLVCLKKPKVACDSPPLQLPDVGVAAVARAGGCENVAPNTTNTVESVGFGDLPLHVLENLMYHVLQLGDVDAVRSARLVCKAWHSSVAVNVTAAVLRPMTRSALDIDQAGRPIINYAADSLRAPPRNYYSSITLEILESAYSVFVPEPEVEESEQPVTLQDAQQAENHAQLLWGRMQDVGGRCLTIPRQDSIGHYPVEDSFYAGSIFQEGDEEEDTDPFNDVESKDSVSSDTVTDMLPACTVQRISELSESTRSSGVGSSVHLELVNHLPQPYKVSALDSQKNIPYVGGHADTARIVQAVEPTSATGESDAAVRGALNTTRQRRWFRSVRGSSSAGEEQTWRRSWLRIGRSSTQVDQTQQCPTADGPSEGGAGDSETVELVRGGSGRIRGGWFRHTRGGSDVSDDTRGSSFVHMDQEDSNLAFDGKAPIVPDGVSPPPSSGFPRLGRGWLRQVRGASADSEDASAQGGSLAGITSANLRGALQSADGAVIMVENEELDAFAKELRQQFIEGECELPTVVLHVVADGVELGAPRSSASGSAAVDGSAPRAEGSSGWQINRLEQLISRGHSHGAEVANPPAAAPAAAVQVTTETAGRGLTASDTPASSSVEGEAREVEVLNAREKQVINFLAQVKEGGDAALEELPAADSKSEISSDIVNSGFEDVHKFPTKRCTFMRAAAQHPVASKHRKQIIIPDYHYTNTCNVDLKLLHRFKNLQVLALPIATKSIDPDDLARLTQLTSLTISMRRRNHLGLGKRLQYLPPPANFNGIWNQAIVQLKELRALNLAHSVGVSDRQIASVTALTNLESLDLTGVQLPISTLRTFACLYCLTQLRIPNVTIVSERFMQLMGECRDVPRLADMLEAMPQLRHLDLYCIEHGENQTILKDPKHMRTLARATQLQRLDIAKLGQVTDSALALLQGLTAITSLKLGCNTFDIYPLTGRAFIMFRTWEHLRVLYLEACRYLQKDAYIALACSCPHLQILHMDTASRVTPAAFALTPMMPELRVLELVSMKLVPNAKITEVCAGLHHLRPGMADHIIMLKKYGVQNLGKFGESVRGGLIGKLLAY